MRPSSFHNLAGEAVDRHRLSGHRNVLLELYFIEIVNFQDALYAVRFPPKDFPRERRRGLSNSFRWLMFIGL